MFVDVDTLKRKIFDGGFTMAGVAKILGIDRSTLYRRMLKGGGNLLVKDAEMLSQILCLSAEERNSIFFAHEVARNANNGGTV